MDNSDLLNLILANSCGTLTEGEREANGGFQIFFIETHCVMWEVHARLVSSEPFTYEVRSATPRDC